MKATRELKGEKPESEGSHGESRGKDAVCREGFSPCFWKLAPGGSSYSTLVSARCPGRRPSRPNTGTCRHRTGDGWTGSSSPGKTQRVPFKKGIVKATSNLHCVFGTEQNDIFNSREVTIFAGERLKKNKRTAVFSSRFVGFWQTVDSGNLGDLALLGPRTPNPGQGMGRQTECNRPDGDPQIQLGLRLHLRLTSMYTVCGRTPRTGNV